MDKKGKRLNPFQHALSRPDIYIGNIKTISNNQWVISSFESTQKDKFEYKKVKYNQGLLRLFIEIMSNAIDNKWRSEKHEIPMKKIEFTLDKETGYITIWNDGYYIPVKKEEYKYEDYRTGKTIKDIAYPAEIFFGEMLAGTNFEDNSKRKTSGRNGIGSKAANIFSKEFIVEQTDPENRKKFIQVYRNNGKIREKPVITSYKAKTGYTKITFLPDYEYFKYPKLDNNLFSILKRNIYDCAMITGLNIIFNSGEDKEKIVIKTLEKYVRLYFPDVKKHKILSFTSPTGSECVIVEGIDPEANVQNNVEHISFVNGIYTKNGGLHVETWRDVIFQILVKLFNSKKRKNPLKTTAKELYPYFIIFVKYEIEDAQFDSNTKDYFTGIKSDEVPQIVYPNDKNKKVEYRKELVLQITKMLKWNFINKLEEKLEAKLDKTQQTKEKTRKKIIQSPKWTDANNAGKKYALECTLFITEGLSAKAFADRIISSIDKGTDYYGSFALKGKFLNVKNATREKINDNITLTDLKNFLGLKPHIDYSKDENFNTLRYGKAVMVTDADDDGIHIRGLLLNLFHTQWPALYNREYVKSFSTCVSKVMIGKKDPILFYSTPSFKQWYSGQTLEFLKKINVNYYKGLGTHKPGDEKQYLTDPKYLLYTCNKNDTKFMELGFNKKKSNERKKWIMTNIEENANNEQEFIYEGPLTLSDFVDKQLIIYHRTDLRRSIPNMYDSFKEGQRKAFYGISIEKGVKPINLENLIGSIKKETSYHHGGESLIGTIVNMTQGFVGTNNIPFFVNEGEYGTRMNSGVHAAARYIFTKMENIMKTIYSPLDEPLLEKSIEDNIEVEYKFFIPILPMILINGASGIACGFSTNIPAYNPDDIIDWILHWLDKSSDSKSDKEDKLKSLKPWYRNFTGEINLVKKNNKTISWSSKGIMNEDKKGLWHITELPINVWPDKMQEYLNTLLTGNLAKGKKGLKCLTDIKWKGKPNIIHFIVKPTKDFTPDPEFKQNFKIMKKLNPLTNMVVLDNNDCPKKYETPEDLLKDFCIFRLHYYDLRKKYWIKQWNKDFKKENNKYKFIKAVLDGNLNMNQKGDILEDDMIKIGLSKIDDSFDYLLSLQMRSMTIEKLNELKKEIEKIKKKIEELKGKMPKDLWRYDIEEFKKAYKVFIKTRQD